MKMIVDVPFEIPSHVSLEVRIDPKEPGSLVMLFEFPNGYRVSLIRGEGSLGGRDGLFELLMMGDWIPPYLRVPFGNEDQAEPIGYLDAADVEHWLSVVSLFVNPNDRREDVSTGFTQGDDSGEVEVGVSGSGSTGE